MNPAEDVPCRARLWSGETPELLREGESDEKDTSVIRLLADHEASVEQSAVSVYDAK